MWYKSAGDNMDLYPYSMIRDPLSVCVCVFYFVGEKLWQQVYMYHIR